MSVKLIEELKLNSEKNSINIVDYDFWKEL